MKTIDMELNIDDRVWVQEYDSDGEPLRLRYARVLGIVPHEEKPPEVMVSYLDGRGRMNAFRWNTSRSIARRTITDTRLESHTGRPHQ